MTDALITELEETIAQAETYDVSTITLPLHEMKILMQTKYIKVSFLPNTTSKSIRTLF